jgi:hypothetical protein
LGCGDDVLTNPLAPGAASLSLSSDYVAWDGNVLEAADDEGNIWKAVRDQPNATHAWIYKNGVLQATMDLQWQGGEVTQITWTDAATMEWSTTTVSEHPEVLAISGGGGSGGGECDPMLDPGCEIMYSSPSIECDEVGAADGEDGILGGCGAQWGALEGPQRERR